MSSLPLARDFIVGDPGAPPTLVNQLSFFCVAQVDPPLEFCSLTASPQLGCKGLLEATDETVALARFNVSRSWLSVIILTLFCVVSPFGCPDPQARSS